MTMPRLRDVSRFVALLLALSPDPALAWGRDGHEIVAAIAQSMLTPRAAAQADALLAAAGGESLVASSDWADRIRGQHRETASWHFVDIEVGEGPYNPARDCKGGRCAVEKITEFEARLADARLDPETRGKALKWVVHLSATSTSPCTRPTGTTAAATPCGCRSMAAT